MATPADRQLVLGALTAVGTATSSQLQAAVGKSQATTSRILSELAAQVIKIGQARAMRYALPRAIHGRPAQHALWWTDETGGTEAVGTLTYLANGDIYVHSQSLGDYQDSALPWYLSPLRAEGFLGRIAAKRLAALEADPDPQRWSLETQLYAALQVHDAPGAITLGRQEGGIGPLQLPRANLHSALDEAAQTVAQTLPAGSSAGGEQPKFLALLENGHHVIVKFSPPLASPGGQRWSDLLHAEHLACRALQQCGIESAASEVIQTTQRTYLVSRRFDRLGVAGRRHVVAIGKAHEAFVQGAYRNWAETAEALSLAGRLDGTHANTARVARDFGRLIGNTDMHSNNLGLFVQPGDVRRGRFALAPVYDMLPMRYRPNPIQGGLDDYAPFEPDEGALGGEAAEIAAQFWEALASTESVSEELREVAGVMAERVHPTTPALRLGERSRR